MQAIHLKFYHKSLAELVPIYCYYLFLNCCVGQSSLQFVGILSGQPQSSLKNAGLVSPSRVLLAQAIVRQLVDVDHSRRSVGQSGHRDKLNEF
jgi:hypothetical protein